ncbi:hypothetical protein Y1Q_0020854 [Alligator mississippiensis]|uniref:Uncharacterized protein n=1 Tax=Alligator mississippiensis TaxID=8496 RepID=A0A151NJ38_ALLMI|nr:hypothetical protein Y1Q_0020854 [Alligator mississippiensis]
MILQETGEKLYLRTTVQVPDCFRSPNLATRLPYPLLACCRNSHATHSLDLPMPPCQHPFPVCSLRIGYPSRSKEEGSSYSCTGVVICTPESKTESLLFYSFFWDGVLQKNEKVVMPMTIS